jgi:hypothetical protein
METFYCDAIKNNRVPCHAQCMYCLKKEQKYRKKIRENVNAFKNWLDEIENE